MLKRTPPETWILNGTLFTQNSKREVLNAHLRLVDGRIAEIRRSLPTRLSKGSRRIDARGLAILPGFVQTHVHLCQTLFRNQADDLELLDWLSRKIWPLEAAHTAETLYTSARLGIHELLSGGTTCLLDMGTVRHTDSIFQAVLESGIRANVGKCLMDHPKQTPPGLRDRTEVALTEAYRLYMKWNGVQNDRIRASYAPRFVVSCTEELLRDLRDVAREQGAIIHTHSSENRKEIELVRKLTGKDNVAYFHHLGLTSPRLVLAHCIWLSARELNILRDTGTHVAHCPSSNLKLASGIAEIPKMRSLGINVSLGADGAPCNNNLNMFQEMRLAALIHKPGGGPKTLRAQEALDLATRNGAKALGWWDQIGSIEVGKKADLISLDLQRPENIDPESGTSSIVYSSDRSHVRWTMVDGHTLYSDGRVHTIPTAPLLEDVRRAWRDVSSGTKAKKRPQARSNRR